MSVNSSEQLTLQESIAATTIPVYFIFSLGFIGNGLALYVLISSSSVHKWAPFQRLVLGLIVTDAGGSLLIFPTILVRFASNFTYVFPPVLCNFSSFTLMFTITSSALIVCMMSVDRFVAVLFPMAYKAQNKQKRVNIMLVSVWVFSAIFSSLHLLGFGSNFNFYPGTWCFLNYLGKSVLDRASAFVFAIFGILVILVIVISNCVVIVTLCRTKLSGSTRSHVSIAVYLVVLVTLFLVCTAPVMITMLSFAAQWTTEKDPKDNTAVALAVTNAIFDPWIYILLRNETLIRIRKQTAKLRSCLPCCQENLPGQQEESVADSGETPDSVRTEVDVV